MYYMNFIIAQKDANVRFEKLKILGVQPFVDNQLLGFVGRKAVFPLRLENLEDQTRDYLYTKLLAGWVDSRGIPQLPAVKPSMTSVALPTGGLYMEAVLGQCDALEPFLAASRDVELAAAKAQVELAEERVRQLALETQRRRMKLDKGDLYPA